MKECGDVSAGRDIFRALQKKNYGIIVWGWFLLYLFIYFFAALTKDCVPGFGQRITDSCLTLKNQILFNKSSISNLPLTNQPHHNNSNKSLLILQDVVSLMDTTWMQHWKWLFGRHYKVWFRKSRYLIINIEPFWVMVHLLCLQSHTWHEAKCLLGNNQSIQEVDFSSKKLQTNHRNAFLGNALNLYPP